MYAYHLMEVLIKEVHTTKAGPYIRPPPPKKEGGVINKFHVTS